MKPITLLNPETITIIDPACGSGHILVEAYDVLKAIYLERGYQLRSIPRLILEKNLYGLDIDDRAAQLAGFALLMKARADDRRLFDELPKLNVYSLQSSKNLSLPLLWQQLDLNGQIEIGTTGSLFDEPQVDLVQVIDDSNYQLIENTLALFEQAQTLGSLIQVPAEHAEPLRDLLAQLQALSTSGDTIQTIAATTLIPFIRQAVILGMQFDAVVANPPYMGGKGMNPGLKEFAKREFPDSKSDLFAMFMERGFQWCKPTGFNAMVTMQSWMFLSSYQAMREKLLENRTINTMAHLGARAFSEISGEVVQTTAFVLLGQHFSGYKPAFFRLVDGQEEQKQAALCSGQNRFDTTVQDDFKKISGSPVAYWVSDKERELFTQTKSLGQVSFPRKGMDTGKNALFLRYWHEISILKFSKFEGIKWFPYNKGGEYRRWYGNQEYVLNWESNGQEIKSRRNLKVEKPTIRNEQFYMQEGFSWSTVSSTGFAARYSPDGAIFDNGGCTLFAEENLGYYGALLNSKITSRYLEFISPTLNFQPGDIGRIPVIEESESNSIDKNTECLIKISKIDWNNYETSWDFTENPLIGQQQNTLKAPVIPAGMPESSHRDVKLSANTSAQLSIGANAKLPSVALDSGIPAGMTAFGIVPTLQRGNAASDAPASRNAGALPDECPRRSVGTISASTNLEQCFNRWQTQNRAAIVEMQRLEKENNCIFIDAYGLQDELSPEVPEAQITLARADREKDSQRLISYAIGCMMGRYSLDEPGLIYAHAGNVGFDPNRYATFPADADGIVPITDELWFEDDAANRLNEFLLAVWNAETLEENRAWLATSLGQKGNETPQETIRRYIAGSFYKNHLQTYKKRPIYWLFSSGKQGAFQALVYLHRYHESTLARMRAEYVVPLTGKIQSRIEMLKKDADAATSNAEKSKLGKDIDKLKKKYAELLSFDEKLRHYADLRIPLDLDDGVKVNYGKFGDLLAEVKAVTGGKDE